MEVQIDSQIEMIAFGERLGSLLRGGEMLQLVGDVGAGKTTLTKAIANGMGIVDDLSSPSYTLSQVYTAPSGVRLVHYDFYRLTDPGILAAELKEAQEDADSVIVIEWGDIVAGLLPTDHLQIRITTTNETARRVSLVSGGEKSGQLLEQLK